jgi:hypothetical protein
VVKFIINGSEQTPKLIEKQDKPSKKHTLNLLITRKKIFFLDKKNFYQVYRQKLKQVPIRKPIAFTVISHRIVDNSTDIFSDKNENVGPNKPINIPFQKNYIQKKEDKEYSNYIQ